MYGVFKGKHLLYPLFLLILAIILMIFFARDDKDHTDTISTGYDGRIPIILYPALNSSGMDRESYTGFLKADLEDLAGAGYTTVFVNDLIRYVNYGGELPERPAVLIFPGDNWTKTEAVPLIEANGIRASVALTGEYVLEASESAGPDTAGLTWSDIYTLRESGTLEFINNGYFIHEGRVPSDILAKDGLTFEEQRHMIYNDLFRLQQELEGCCDFRPNAFLFPGGKSDDSSEKIIGTMGFEATLIYGEGRNLLRPGAPECLYDLNVSVRDTDTDIKDNLSSDG